MARKIVIEFLGDSKDLQRAMDDVDGSSSRMTSNLKKVGKVAGLAFAAAGIAAVKFGGDAIADASELSETLNKSSVVFGKHAGSIEKWADGAAKNMGLSKAAALGAAAQFGDLFSQLGSTKGEAASTSKDIVKLATDLGSFHNLETGDVLDKISGALRGEYDSIQKIVPALSDARVKQEALTATGKTSADQLTEQEKATAALAIITRDSANAHNDFAETSGGLANQQKILKAQLSNVSAEIGAKLLPVATAVVTFFNDSALPAFQRFGGWLQDHLPPIFEKIQSVIAAVMGSVNSDVGGNLAAVQQIFTDVTDIITTLWNRFGGTIIDYAVKTFANIKQVISGALTVVQGIFQTFAALLHGDWAGAWDGVKKILSGAWQVITGIVKQYLNLVGTLMEIGWSAVKGIVGSVWDGIKTVISNGISNIVGWIADIPGKLRDRIGSFREAGAALIGGVVDGMKNAGGVIEGIASNVWNAVRSLLNSAIDKINAALEFTISLPGPDLTINPANIPHLAKGGLVTSPTLALIGEDGPEAVVPLSKKHNPGGVMPGMGGSSAPIIVQFVMPGGRVIEQLLIQHSRDTGRPLQVSTLGPA